MLHPKVAGDNTGTLGQLTLAESGNIIALALAGVAVIAEVGISPAEPLGYRTAKLALVLDVLCAVILAVAHAAADVGGHAAGAYQVFDLELLLLLLGLDAVFHTAVVWLLALEALVIGQLEHTPSSQVVVIISTGLPDPGIFIDAFILGSEQGFLFNVPLKDQALLNLVVDLLAVVCSHLSFALRAIQEGEGDTGGQPLEI